MDDLTRAAKLEDRARLERVLRLVLPRVGYRIAPETVQRLDA